MKASSWAAKLFVAAIFFAATMFTGRLHAQDEPWQVVRADYGYKSQRNDVTDLVRDLISRGGGNGRVAVGNQTMGGDPAVGADKTLRIFARNRRGEERTFEYKEGATIEVGMFFVPVPDNDWGNRNQNSRWGDRDDGYAARERDDWNALWIIRGYYGTQGRMANVTDLLRSRVREGMLVVDVSNDSLGVDPAVGEDKVLRVVYRYQGKEQAAAVREGRTLSIP